MKPPWLTWIRAYLAAWLAIALLDALWLGWLARGFYQQEMGDLMIDQVRVLPALGFYLGYPLGLVALLLTPRPATLKGALARAATVGVLAYGTYDLTNLATLQGWSPLLAAVDVGWGLVVSSAGGAAAWWASRPGRR